MSTVDEKLDRLIHSVQSMAVKIEQLRIGVDAMAKANADHEQRLRVIERWHNKMSPLLAVATFVLGAVFKMTLERL